MAHIFHFLKDFKQTGALAPSSKFLAKDITKPLKQKLLNNEGEKLNILEIGPGTGPLTKELASKMRLGDHLDVVEIHQHFYRLVKRKYARSNIRIHHNDILGFEPGKSYDFIFSSLPYENMPVEISRKIWEKKLLLCNKNACICYFKYVNFRKFKNNFEEMLVERYKRDKKIVWLNLPPARLFTLQIDENWKNLASPGWQVA